MNFVEPLKIRFVIELRADSNYVDLRENHFDERNSKTNEQFAAERRRRGGEGRERVGIHDERKRERASFLAREESRVSES